MTVIERLIKRRRRESQKITEERQKVVMMRLADDECTAFLRLWAGGGAVECGNETVAACFLASCH